MGLGNIIDQLTDPDHELTPALLGKLSGLLRDDAQELSDSWPEIPPSRRLEVVQRLIDMAEHDIEMDIVPVLRNALEDQEPEVRICAASGLWETSDRTVIKPLVGLLLEDDSDATRAAAAVTLGHFVELGEAGKLIDRDVTILEDALFSVLDDADETLEVRRRALEAIAPSHHPSVAGWVQWAYDSDEPLLGQSAIYAMGRTCDDVWLPTITKEMTSADTAMRFEAANAAREMGDPKALPYLHELVDDDDLTVAVAAVQAVGGIGGAMAKKLLKRYEERNDGPVSEAAAEALRLIESEDLGF